MSIEKMNQIANALRNEFFKEMDVMKNRIAILEAALLKQAGDKTLPVDFADTVKVNFSNSKPVEGKKAHDSVG